MSDHLITICSRCGSSRSNHHFHCLSLIHRCIAGGDLVQADREIQNGRGIEPTRKDLVQQFWQIGALEPAHHADQYFWKTSVAWEPVRFHAVLQLSASSLPTHSRTACPPPLVSSSTSLMASVPRVVTTSVAPNSRASSRRNG